jgi:ABC-type transport system involved in cytochrome bd biosynthesis fused ATPase/permease subunit
MPRVLARWLPVVAAILVGGTVMAIADGNQALLVIGLVLIGLGVVLIVSLIFYEVGRSEDRAREEENRAP